MARGHHPHPGSGFSRRKRGDGPAAPYRPSGGGGTVFLPTGKTVFRPAPRVRRAGRRYRRTGQGPDQGCDAPPPHVFHWTLSAPAERTGMVRSTTHNIPTRHGPEPVGIGTSKGSRDPGCGRKTHDIVGLVSILPTVPSCYRWPESGGSRLRRAQRGRCRRGRESADPHARPQAKRHRLPDGGSGIATGKVVGRMTQRHRSRESSLSRAMWRRALIRWRTFMSSPATSPPRVAGVHKWPARHPRWTFHFNPTSASWTNAAGAFSRADTAASTERRLRFARRLRPVRQGMARTPQRKLGLRVPVGRKTKVPWRVLET